MNIQQNYYEPLNRLTTTKLHNFLANPVLEGPDPEHHKYMFSAFKLVVLSQPATETWVWKTIAHIEIGAQAT